MGSAEDIAHMWRCNECGFYLCEACGAEQASPSNGHSKHEGKPVSLMLRLLSGHHFPRPQKAEHFAIVAARTQFAARTSHREEDAHREPISPYTHIKIHGVE